MDRTLSIDLDGELQIACLTDTHDFQNLVSAWNEIVSNTETKSVFLRHEWFNAAWQWKQKNSQLRLLCLYRNGDLFGICPLVYLHRRIRRFPVRVLEFLTVPDTQHCDVITTANDHAKAVQGIAQWLRFTETRWDILDLRYIPIHSVTRSTLPSALANYNIKCKIKDGGSNSFVDLTGTWEKFYSTRSRRLKKGNNLAANKLRRQGKTEVEWINNSSNGSLNIEHLLNDVINISSRSWKKNIGLSLNKNGPKEFIRTLTRSANDQGWLSVWLLRVEGRPIATEYQLQYANQVHALRSDFNECYSELSPGTYLNWKILEGLFEKGLTRYYMGPGSNPYKRRWTDKGDQLCALTAYNINMRGRLISIVELTIHPIAKSIFLKIKSIVFPSRGGDQT